MRLTLLALFVGFIFARAEAQLPQQDHSDQGVATKATYEHIPARTEALGCLDPSGQADCKVYFAGFAQTIDLLLSTDPSTQGEGYGVCGDITDLLAEFEHEVKTNPKVFSAETHEVLFALLVRNHNCKKIHTHIQSITAGSLSDMCYAGDVGFGLCSQYQFGFMSALFFVSDQTGKQVLCGDLRRVTPVNISGLLNDKLEENFQLRRAAAVGVMLDALKSKMPCPDK